MPRRAAGRHEPHANQLEWPVDPHAPILAASGASLRGAPGGALLLGRFLRQLTVGQTPATGSTQGDFSALDGALVAPGKRS